MTPHRFQLRVYYEDTDLAGIVYYANYLRFIERARSEMLRANGVDQKTMQAAGMVFVVKRLTAEFIAAAHYDDLVDVETRVSAMTGATLSLMQSVQRGDKHLFEAEVTIACMQNSGKPTRIPADIRQKMQDLM